MSKSVVPLLALAFCGATFAAALVVTRRARPADPAECGESCIPPTPPAQATREVAHPATVLEDPASVPEAEGTSNDGTADAAGGRTTITGPYAELLGMPERDRTEMEIKVAAVQKVLSDATGPLLDQRFADGRTTPVPDGQRPQGKGTDAAEIAGLKTIPGKGTFRAVLPRSEYPELYQLRDTVVRLQRQLVRLSNAKTREWERDHPPKSK